MKRDEKVFLLLDLAKQVSTDLPGGSDLVRRSIYLACGMYRNRTGKMPTRAVIDMALRIGF